MIGQHLEASRTVSNKSTTIHIPITYWYLSNICFLLIDHLTDSSFTIPIIKFTHIIIIAFFTEPCMGFFVILRKKSDFTVSPICIIQATYEVLELNFMRVICDLEPFM